MEEAALNWVGGGDEHVCKWLCMILCAVESSRGSDLVADYAGVTLLRVQSCLTL